MLGLDRCAVESLAPLADAYRRSASLPRRARVTVLSLLGARDICMRDVVLEYAFTMGGMLNQCCFRPVTDFDREVEWLAPLLQVLTDGATDGVLRELHIDLLGMREADQRIVLTRLASSLSTQSLARLHVVCRFTLLATCAAQLGRSRDAVLRDPPRVRCATLSVLRAFGCAAPEMARMVLAWSEGSVVRTVTWDGG